MKVKCVHHRIEPEDLERLGFVKGFSRDFDLTLGKDYLVIGLTCNEKPSAYGRGVILEVIDDFDRWSMAPMCLFHVTDPQPSSCWIVRKYGDMGLRLWPESFFQDYYHDRLTDGDPEIVADFERVLALLEAEHVSREPVKEDDSESGPTH